MNPVTGSAYRPNELEPSQETQRSWKRLLFYPAFEMPYLNTLYKAAVPANWKRYRIKQPFTKKITFQSIPLKLYSTVIQRTSKFIKTIDGTYPKCKPFLHQTKQMKSLKKVIFKYSQSSFHEVYSLKIMLKSAKYVQTLILSLTVFYHLYNKHQYQLWNLKSLQISKEKIYNNSSYPRKKFHQSTDDEHTIDLLSKGKKFPRLANITLYLQSKHHKSSFLYTIFQKLSDLPSLRALQLTLSVNTADKLKPNMKEIMEKFVKLEYLGLTLNLNEITTPGDIFSVLDPPPNLKSLYLDLSLDAKPTIDISGLKTFLESLKALERIKLNLQRLCFVKVNEILEAIKTLTGLTSLSLLKIASFGNGRYFEAMYETIKALPLLESLIVNYGNYIQDPKEMAAFPKCLLEHPTLQRVKASLTMPMFSAANHEFTEEFFKDLQSLRSKLKDMKIELKHFPEEVARRITEIINA